MAEEAREHWVGQADAWISLTRADPDFELFNKPTFLDLVPPPALTVANAGHPEPLLITSTSADYLTTRVGPPLGVEHQPSYTASQITVPSDATLLLYTDGAIERRGETLDIGMRRLRQTAANQQTTLWNRSSTRSWGPHFPPNPATTLHYSRSAGTATTGPR